MRTLHMHIYPIIDKNTMVPGVSTCMKIITRDTKIKHQNVY